MTVLFLWDRNQGAEDGEDFSGSDDDESSYDDFDDGEPDR